MKSCCRLLLPAAMRSSTASAFSPRAVGRLSSGCIISGLRGWHGSRAKPGSNNSSIFRRSAPIQLTLGLCTKQGPGRGCGPQFVSDRHDFTTVGGVQAGRSILQPFCGDGDVLAGLALDRRRAYAFSTGLSVMFCRCRAECLEDPTTAGRTYELGGPKIYTFRDLVELLLGEIRRRKTAYRSCPFGARSGAAGAVLPEPAG